MVFVLGMALANVKSIKLPVKDFIKGNISFGQFTNSIADSYVGKLKGKNAFVEINGLFNRLCGRIVHNDVVLLKNNVLNRNSEVEWNSEYEKNNMTDTVERMTDFNYFLKDKQIPFVQVIAPYKVPVNKDNLPEGVENDVNKYTDEYIDGLNKNGVLVLDLRKVLSANSEQVKNYFYRTDHHWNTDGAFLAFKVIMNNLTNDFGGIYNIKSRYADVGLWQRIEIKDWFLGSQGKRVGTLFAGTDSLIYYIPKFKTHMSCIVPHSKNIFKGDFTAANIRDKYVQKRDYYRYDAYNIHIGGNFPLVKHRNKYATNDMKLFVIKDSFTLPLQAFMSTEFTEIDVIDPRYYRNSSVAEYILWTRPDLVLKVNAPIGLTAKEYNEFGVKDGMHHNKKVLLSNCSIILEANDSNYTHKKLPVNLMVGKTYKLDIGSLNLTKGKTDGISLMLFDFKNKKIIRHEILDVEFEKHKDSSSWTFKMPKEMSDYGLLIYSGVYGKTKGIGIEVNDIAVFEEI